MSVFNDLSEPFPREVERQLKKGGATLTYIPVSEIITRLNKVLGVDMWSYKIICCERDALDPDFIVAHVELSATFVPTNDAPALTVVKHGNGDQKIKRTKNGDIVDLGDEMKGAVSDALKKAAQHLGVGLYLARTEESIALEETADAANNPISNDHFDKLRNLLNGLSEDHRIMAKKYWEDIGAGKDFVANNITNTMLSDILNFVKNIRSEEGQ